MEVRAGYKQTEAGIIPEEWESRGLLSTVSIASGQVDPRMEPFRSMFLVAPDHIEPGTGKLLAKTTAGEQRAISGKYAFSAGDIVYSKIRPYLKKAILADFVGLCSADMYPLRPVEGIDAGYILPTLLGHRFTKYAETVSVRSGMPKINREELADFSVAVPPLPEQRAIATALSDVDALLDGLDRLIAKKRDLKQATMQQLLTGQTRLPGFSGEWEIRRLGEICDISIGRTPARLNQSFWGRGHKWLSIADLQSKVISESKEEVTDAGAALMSMVPAGTLLMSFKLSIGRLAFAGCDLYTNEAICAFNHLQADAAFMYYALGRTDFSLYGKQAVKGYTLNSESLRSVEVRLPSNEEQVAISTLLADMDDEIVALEARRDKTRALKQGMMQELLTGKTRLVNGGARV